MQFFNVFNKGGPLMKSITKILLVGAIAVTAIAVSAVPSEAKKKMKRAKAMSPGFVGQLCTTGCGPNNVCKVMIFLADGKWYQAGVTPVCVQPYCPAACR